ncbi:HAD-IA family hydrolase [Vibrio sp. DW001]|uniref:HAD family hydrolase n=1 Tax=Vibrio sp. DW001 TaxID=2912315 RepID=UPI0023AF2471|nr:HAD-IA family hydrolase [Vibrio sp. DW001]WED28258.1 HAD-IA family hydrolase [Vibrio sp. DW001]
MYRKELFIFDMDGVLLDSEPHWRKAQIELLEQLGINITEEECILYTMGKRIDDIAAFWIERFNLTVDQNVFTSSLLQKTAALICQRATAREGIYTLIDFLQKKGCRIALATSSSYPIISAVLEKLDIMDVFELTLSADDVEYGKPLPDVYLEVCRLLGVSTNSAIALEDSITGVRSAVCAKITTIAIPEQASKEFDIANHIVGHLDEVVGVVAEYL